MTCASALIFAFACLGQNPSAPTYRLMTIDGRQVIAEHVAIDGKQRLTLDSPRLEGTSTAPTSWPKTLDDLVEIRISGTMETGSSAAARQAERPFRMHWAAGGTATGSLAGLPASGAAASHGTIRFDAGLGSPLDIPLKALAGIEFSRDSSAALTKAVRERLAMRDKTRDVLMIEAPEGIVSFNGAMEGLDPGGWRFQIGGRTRTGEFNKPAAIILAAGLAGPAPVTAILHLIDGNDFPGHVEDADSTGLRFKIAAGPTIRAPWTRVEHLAIKSSRVRFVSELEPTEALGEGFFGAAWPWQRNLSTLGRPIRLGGKTYARGLGVHSRSRLTYAVPPQMDHFAAVIGIDDAANGRGEVVFRVRAGTRVLYESPAIRGGQKPLEIDVALEKVDRVVLEVDFAGGLDVGDHADWANARFVGKT